jgi:hypothetical protein
MTEDMKDLERDIEETRARLDLTIDRLQDKLSVSGIVDDMLGTARAKGFDSAFDHALGVLKRNPVPVMLVAAGIGWLLHRLSREPVRTDDYYEPMLPLEEPVVPIVSTGRARVYDPDSDPMHPNRDPLATDFDVRA